MKNLCKIITIVIALCAPSPVLAQVGGPYGPGPVPCAYTACTVTTLQVGTTLTAGGSGFGVGQIILRDSTGTIRGGLNTTSGVGNLQLFNSSGLGITLSAITTGVSQLGGFDAASPTAQILQAQSVIAGNANAAGATFTVAGSKSNGSGGGDVAFQTTLSNAASGTQNTLATALTLKGGTQAAVFAGVINAAGLATSSAGTTGTLCWTTGTGLFNVDTTTTCLLSLEELKDIRGPISGAEALADVLALKPFWGTWKKSTPEYAGDKAEQPFLGAHQVASVDKRLAAYAPNGALHGVRYQELTAILVGAIKAQQSEIEALFAAILALVGWNLWLAFRKAA